MYKLYIVDDDPTVVRNLEYLIVNYSKHLQVVGSSSVAKVAIAQISSLKPDILFLDIDIPEINGFQLLSELHKNGRYPEVVFISAYDNYAIEAFKVNAVHYIVKPANPKSISEIEERLIKEVLINQSNIIANLKGLTWKKIMGFLNRQAQRELVHFSAKGFEISTYVSEIIYLKAEGSYCKVYCINKKSFILSKNLVTILGILPESEFSRVHRSYVVNLAHVERLELEPNPCFYLSEGIEIRISARSRKQVLEEYRAY